MKAGVEYSVIYTYELHDPLPDTIIDAVKPTFEHLASKELLQQYHGAARYRMPTSPHSIGMDNVPAGGLFLRNDRGEAEVIPSEQTSQRVHYLT